MKSAGTFTDRNDAETFLAYLHAIGIESKIDRERDLYEIWVFEWDQCPHAKEELTRFHATNDRSEFERKAQEFREAEIKKAREKIVGREKPRRVARAERPFLDQVPVTTALAASCAAIFLFTEFGRTQVDLLSLLKISSVPAQETLAPSGTPLVRFLRLPEVLAGQVWRLWTPALLHADFAHVFFNVLWLLPLGSAIEYRRGSVFFAAFVAVVALGSNLAQFTQAGPNFVGISGVVSGLFGYVLMFGKFAPDDGIGIESKTATFMLLYLGICLTDLIPNAANWSHFAGLALGAGVASAEIGIRRARGRG